MNVKICGLTTSEAIAEINRQHVDFAGFIAYDKSPRYINPKTYQQLASQLNADVKCVLVTVDANHELISQYIEVWKPDFLQLHGSETAQTIVTLKQNYNIQIIKAIPANGEMAVQIEHFQNVVDMLLFDTQTANNAFGGTGETFDWAKIANLKINIPWFLSGGIGAHNVIAAMEVAKYIDVSSHLETQKAIKDVAKIADFMNIVNSNHCLKSSILIDSFNKK